MIIDTNGILRIKLSSNKELDNDGYPNFSNGDWGDLIECNIRANSQSNIGVTVNGNTFETSDFEVLIEQQSFSAKIINLIRDGVDLGEFQVQGTPEQLNIAGNIKIMVKCLSNV